MAIEAAIHKSGHVTNVYAGVSLYDEVTLSLGNENTLTLKYQGRMLDSEAKVNVVRKDGQGRITGDILFKGFNGDQDVAVGRALETLFDDLSKGKQRGREFMLNADRHFVHEFIQFEDKTVAMIIKHYTARIKVKIKWTYPWQTSPYQTVINELRTMRTERANSLITGGTVVGYAERAGITVEATNPEIPEFSLVYFKDDRMVVQSLPLEHDLGTNSPVGILNGRLVFHVYQNQAVIIPKPTF